jgi:diaminopimelate decarboxylase
VVFDTGAYGYTMSSNYNGRLRPPEYLVDGRDLILIRHGESYQDQMRLFNLDLEGK